MTSISLRKEVLNAFKALHRTRLKIFAGDEAALTSAREKINCEFKKNKDISDQHVISEQIQLAKGVEMEIRTTVVQAREVKPGVYEARLNSETIRLDNIPFEECGNEVYPKPGKGKHQDRTAKN